MSMQNCSIVVVKHVLNMTNVHAQMEQQDIVTMLVSAIATIKRVSYKFVSKIDRQTNRQTYM
ncbi:hypothetical protein ACJMK2_022795 [Sinanodonta woodiana]|uniref:Uncharacterized protein n=1 Tax=Sinanodonta woodiana TaxID=1069815 RepID=A0ABD3TLE4_SINWO